MLKVEAKAADTSAHLPPFQELVAYRDRLYFSENRENRENRESSWANKDLRLAAARRAAATSARRRARHGAFSPARHPFGSVAVTASIEGGAGDPSSQDCLSALL